MKGLEQQIGSTAQNQLTCVWDLLDLLPLGSEILLGHKSQLSIKLMEEQDVE